MQVTAVTMRYNAIQPMNRPARFGSDADAPPVFDSKEQLMLNYAGNVYVGGEGVKPRDVIDLLAMIRKQGGDQDAGVKQSAITGAFFDGGSQKRVGRIIPALVAEQVLEVVAGSDQVDPSYKLTAVGLPYATDEGQAAFAAKRALIPQTKRPESRPRPQPDQ